MSRWASIPAITGAINKATAKILQPIKQRLEIWSGEHGNPLDKVLFYRDFQDGTFPGLIRSQGGLPASVTGVLGGNGSSELDFTPPGPLTDLVAQGSLASIILTWEGTTQAHYAYSEVWRSDDSNLGHAVLRGTAIAAVFVDSIGTNGSFYYWVRGVSSGEAKGPFNAVDGTLGTTGKDPTYVRGLLTSTVWKPSTEYDIFQVVKPTTNVVVSNVSLRFQAVSPGTSGGVEPNWAAQVSALGDQLTDGTITWEAVDPGKAPFITGTVDGKPVVYMPGAVLQDLTVTDEKVGNLGADKLFAVTGTIASVIIGTGDIQNAMIGDVIQSRNYSAYGGAGWSINKNGSASFGNVFARGNITATSLNAATGTFSGNLTAAAVNAVDTINLAGQAVTIPVGASGSATSGTNAHQWTTIVSRSINFPAVGSIAPQTIVLVSAYTNDVIENMRILRNGSLIYYPNHKTMVTSASPAGGESGGYNYTYSSFCVDIAIDSPGFGTVTYQLQMETNSLSVTAQGTLAIIGARR